MGIIDTISAGFGLVNRRLWFITIPVLLDFFLWLGPKFSIAPWLTDALEGYYQALSRSGVQLAPEHLQSLQSQGAQFVEVFGNLNLVGVLAWQVPSIIGADLSDVATLTGRIPLYTLESGRAIVALFLALGLLGLGVACLYLGPMAQCVRFNATYPWRLFQRLAVNWARLLSFFALVAFVLMSFGAPFVFLVTLASTLNPDFGRLLSGLMLAVVLWGWIYLFFAVNAILVSEVSALEAIRYSATVVRRNFGASLRFIGLVILIQWGLPVAWNQVLKHALVVPVAIVGNAYIATGLAAASMIFYWDRLVQWQKANQPVLGRDVNP